MDATTEPSAKRSKRSFSIDDIMKTDELPTSVSPKSPVAATSLFTYKTKTTRTVFELVETPTTVDKSPVLKKPREPCPSVNPTVPSLAAATPTPNKQLFSSLHNMLLAQSAFLCQSLDNSAPSLVHPSTTPPYSVGPLLAGPGPSTTMAKTVADCRSPVSAFVGHSNLLTKHPLAVGSSNNLTDVDRDGIELWHPFKALLINAGLTAVSTSTQPNTSSPTSSDIQLSSMMLVGRNKRLRTAFSPSQLLQLERTFEENHYLIGQERRELANQLQLSETQVKVWFQNRRTKEKRLLLKSAERKSSEPPSSDD